MPDDRLITCYHCRHRFEIGAKALSTSCPKCSKQLRVDDIVVKGLEAVRKIQTCGSLVIQKKARVNAQLVEAHLGVEVDGVMEANVLSGGPVRIGAKAIWKGNCNAPSLVVELGAQISSGLFNVPDLCVALPEPSELSAPASTAAPSVSAPVVEPKPARARPGAAKGTR